MVTSVTCPVPQAEHGPGKTYEDIRLDRDRHGNCRHAVACAPPWADINAFSIPASFTAGAVGRRLSGPGMSGTSLGYQSGFR